MKIDYHMHFEKGSYDEEWVEGFFHQAKLLGLEEIGISEHSHTFPEFKELYYEDLILDDSFVGSFQQQWLRSNKFKYTIDEYFAQYPAIADCVQQYSTYICPLSEKRSGLNSKS